MPLSIPTISLDEALQIAQAARKIAAERFGGAVAVTVMGMDGAIVVQLNDPGTFLGSRLTVAETKARTALHFEKDTPDWGERNPGTLGPEYTGVHGGATIPNPDALGIIGSIGVSGLKAPEDQVVASEAALAIYPEDEGG